MLARSLLLSLLIAGGGTNAFAQTMEQPPSSPAPIEAIPLAPPQLSAGPDPTARTIDQLRREIGALKEIVFSVIDGKFSVITTRLDASDKAVQLLQETTDRQPARTAEAVSQLQALADEKFAGVEKQFTERDVRTDQSAIATKTAVDAALQAAEKSVNDKNASAAEAINKSENNTAERINGLSALIAAGNEATNGKIDDLRQRVQAIESTSAGQALQRNDSSGNIGMFVSLGALAIAAVMMVVTLMRGAPRPTA
jgi:hypothetical protein